MRPTRRLDLMLMLIGTPVLAHHGWRRTADGAMELTGTIVATGPGRSGTTLTVEANGEVWTVEVGLPATSAPIRDRLAEGMEITVRGDPAADRRVRAERMVIGGAVFDPYRERA